MDELALVIQPTLEKSIEENFHIFMDENDRKRDQEIQSQEERLRQKHLQEEMERNREIKVQRENEEKKEKRVCYKISISMNKFDILINNGGYRKKTF